MAKKAVTKKEPTTESPVEESTTLLDHELVPQHTLLSQEEKDAFLADNRLAFKDLPKIMFNDPAIIPLGAKPGDIVQILRPSSTAGVSKFYRGVIDEH